MALEAIQLEGRAVLVDEFERRKRFWVGPKQTFDVTRGRVRGPLRLPGDESTERKTGERKHNDDEGLAIDPHAPDYNAR
jgi:hypothetical protein